VPSRLEEAPGFAAADRNPDRQSFPRLLPGRSSGLTNVHLTSTDLTHGWLISPDPLQHVSERHRLWRAPAYTDTIGASNCLAASPLRLPRSCPSSTPRIHCRPANRAPSHGLCRSSGHCSFRGCPNNISRTFSAPITRTNSCIRQ
jgi:hypothetical protein